MSTLLKNRVSNGTLEYVSGQIESFERFKLKNKWSISYDIRLKNNSSEFKIKPEYSDCLNYPQIELKKLIGKQVTLGIDTDKGLKSNDLKDVVSLKFGEKEYLGFDCVNAKIESDKIEIPLAMIGGVVLFFLVNWANKRLNKK
jgi:hypothetical protein